MIELVSTMVGMGGILITTLMIVVKNEVTAINQVLRVWQTSFISMFFILNKIEPELIAELEFRLIDETENLAQLRERYRKLLP